MLTIVSGIPLELFHKRRSSILFATEDIYRKLCTATVFDEKQDLLLFIVFAIKLLSTK